MQLAFGLDMPSYSDDTDSGWLANPRVLVRAPCIIIVVNVSFGVLGRARQLSFGK